ncbi:YEATS-associated helix-containing protein [Haliscomenobacter hydrossis]|uniref:YEATS-Like-Associating Three TM domain-containing protein n=1 Tax=Haliscomenobacter hydrossis (strain ATCC 27775 / DSM 1100 / LMG 10767 / O) TaxID=760192 RepID=F4KSZ4_HALH1|nr:YEATS-associated helix-containing protein [Haliscomenobacter hydrossis]AEE49101.1 hypothetical protein Halhy_1204 [Haliscomenobacter hydrossis DSM 1100]
MPDSLSNITTNTQNLPASAPQIDWYFIFTLLGIMLITGLIGGYANFLNTPKEERSLMRSLMMGIVATIAIPLFLKVVDSNILNQTQTDVMNYFVYAGCCVLAAFYSAKFLEGLSSRIIQDLQEKVDRTSEAVQENAAKVEENAAKLDETTEKTDMIIDTQIPDAIIPDDVPELEPEELRSRSLLDKDIPVATRSVEEKMEAAFGKNKLQTLESLSKATGMGTEAVKIMLISLEQTGKIKKIDHRGREVYFMQR